MKDKRILAVDDEEIVLKMYKEYFQFRGSALLTSSDGDEVLQIVEEQPVDIIIMDLKMPQKSGKDLLLAIRETHPSIKYIFVTAYATEGLVQELSLMGVADVIKKPCTIRTIYESVEKLAMSSA